jgi:hypothetical protein
MLKTSTRRAIAVLGTGIIATAAILAFGSAPAQAAPSGYFLAKGTGSIYSKSDVVALGVVPGSTAKTFYYKLVNTAPTAESFKVNMLPLDNGSWTLYKGYTAVPNEYVTDPIAPGRSLSLRVKVTLPAGTPQGQNRAQLVVRNPDTHNFIDIASAYAFATNQTGTQRHDLFLKTGSQPYVGGSISTQVETANALRVGNTATFSLRLRNDGASPGAISLGDETDFTQCGSNYSITIKEGTRNVTAAVQAGSYNTGTLAPGAKKDLRVSIKLLSAPTCLDTYYGFTASGPDGSVTQYAHVMVGV